MKVANDMNSPQNKKSFSISEIKQKIRMYCAYQERCHNEVRKKLNTYNVFGTDAEEIITDLIQENYLNEQRFANAFVRGKFNYKKWGIQKITKELKFKNISPYCIKTALKEIDREVYLNTLDELIDKRMNMPKMKKQQVIRFLITKGYSYADISERLQLKNIK
jgi:regulatory protein